MMDDYHYATSQKYVCTTMTPEQSYHAFLIRQRIFCGYETDWHSCYRRAITVRKFQGHDITLCAEHASRLDAARQSDRKQIPQ